MKNGRVSKNAQSFKRTDYVVSIKSSFQKQPSKNVLRKRCSENLQQIYESIQLKNGAVWMAQCALQLYWNHTSAWVFSYKVAAFFQNTIL